LSIAKRADELDKKYGRGPTYGPHDRELILSGTVPEWLLRGAKLCPPELAERCRQLVASLERAHAIVMPLVTDKPGEAGQE